MTIITLETIREKTIEDGDCMLWTGKVGASGMPSMWNCTGRQKVWTLAKGQIPKGMRIGVDCGRKLCLNPDHLVLRTASEISTEINSRPDVKVRRAASNAKTARARLGKINMEIAREIRASSKTGKELAAELNCSHSLVSLVRLNKSWAEPANPWAGLGARAAA